MAATAGGLAGVAGARPRGFATVAPWGAGVVAAAVAGAGDGRAAAVADRTWVVTFGAPAEAAGAILVLEELEVPAGGFGLCAATVAGPKAVAAAPVVVPAGATVEPAAAPAPAIETCTPAGWDDWAVDTLTPEAA